MIGGVGEADQKFKTREIVIDAIGLNEGVLNDPVLRTELATHEMNIDAYDMTIERAIDEAKSGIFEYNVFLQLFTKAFLAGLRQSYWVWVQLHIKSLLFMDYTSVS